MLEKVSGVKIGRGKIEEIINAARITGLTGNYEVDFLNSREKRLYTGNDTEIRRAKNTSPLLLQTYMRDTGEILNDLALPIYVNGTHWGNSIVGLKPELLQQD